MAQTQTSESQDRGLVRAALFDWAGTVVDYGSRAPAGIFVEVFRKHGVTITPAQARGPMGMEKRAHIAAIAALPEVQSRWQSANGRPIGDRDIDQMYDEFLPLQLECLPRYSELIPGTLETVAACRRRGIRIGTSTGYARVLMDVLVPLARKQGFEPDAVVCADDVTAGRPKPWMCSRNAELLGVYPPATIVVVDDTIPGLEAGLNAGMWAVGVAKSGNELGLAEQEIAALPAADLATQLESAYRRLYACGSHFVVDSVADLMPIIDEIEGRLRAGTLPGLP